MMKCSGIIGVFAILSMVSVSVDPQPAANGQIPQATEPSAVQRYTPEDVVGIIAVQPSRMLKSRFITKMVEAAAAQKDVEEMMAATIKEMGVDPRTIQEAAVLFDRETIDNTLNPMKTQAGSTVQLKNNLKQIALAMHNMHDTYNYFPDDDGLDDDNKGNLSWRVWILPYMEQAALYNQFHLDEPWDSDHNKTLIDQMPEIFESPGVTEKGQTAVHMFTGEGAPFAGDEAPKITDITDGTSNTIMTVLAGTDKADVWTKPGGLDFDAENPIKALGKIDKEFLVGLMDGSVRALSSDIDPESLASLISCAGGEGINHALLDGHQPARVQSMPGIILRTIEPLNRDTVFNVWLTGLGEGKPGKIDSQDVSIFESCMVTMPDEKTLLVGPEPLLKKMLSPRAAGDKSSGKVQRQLIDSFPANDVAGMIDLEPLKDLKDQMAKNSPMPGLFEGLQGAMFSADLAGTGEFLSQMKVQTANKNSARTLSALAQGMLQMQKAQMLSMANAPDSPASPSWAELLAELFDTVKITTHDSAVSYEMPKPENMDSFVESLTPVAVSLAETLRAARKASVVASRRNNMKQIGLAFHEYHDVDLHFPASNGNGEAAQGQQTGLSWRVYLLPFIDQADLYQQFKLDEAWDSPHNKALIEKMPDVFKVEGIDKPGYTSIHVFTGENTAIGTDEGVGIRDITDGTSNTLLAIVAGPETAEAWTKPGGLEFNADDPKKPLGTLREQFLVVKCDGAVRFLNSDIDDETLRNLIQRDDGNVVEIE